jgi:hypothetical protein
MSLSISTKPNATLYRCRIEDGRCQKFKKGDVVIHIWSGTTDYGLSSRVIHEQQFLNAVVTGIHPMPRSQFVKTSHLGVDIGWGVNSSAMITKDEAYQKLVEKGVIVDKEAGNVPVIFYGEVKQETDKAYLINVADLSEPKWFPKSQMVERGKLSDRDRHAFELPVWMLKKKIGDDAVNTFQQHQEAIRKRLVT